MTKAEERQPPIRSGSRRRCWPVLVGLSFLTSGGLAGAVYALDQSLFSALLKMGASEGRVAEPVTVIIQRVSVATEVDRRRFVAVLKPRAEMTMAFQVAGRVEARKVEVGDRIKGGQELARLAASDFQLAVDQAAAEARAAEAALGIAVEDERRVSALNASGIVSKASLDTARNIAQEARARLDKARADVDLSANSLTYTTLRAEVDGIVQSQSAEPGQIVAPGEPVLTIASSGILEAEIDLPENYPLPSRGDAASFVPWAEPDRRVAAHLREITPTADSTTHTFRARYVLSGGDTGLSSGMTGHLVLAARGGGERLLRLPASALYDGGAGGGPGLWQLTHEDRLAFVSARLVRLDGDNVLLHADLSEDDRIVALGANQLAAGLQVVPFERAPE